MIRSTRHHIHDLNFAKKDRYLLFVEEYSRVVIEMVDRIWAELPKDLKVSMYLDYKSFGIETNLSARAMSSAVTQASGIVRSVIEKQRRRIWVRKKLKKKVKNVKFSKPKLIFVAPNLSSKCCDFEESDGKFHGFLRLKSIGRAYGEIRIPLIRHPRAAGEMRAGFIFYKHKVQVAWDVEAVPIERGTRIVGLDQGLKTVATLSDGQTTPQYDAGGYSYEAILDKISRRRKGSSGFRKAVAHRKNFVNYSINRLNFSGIREVRLEKVVNIRFRKKTSRKMSHWSNPEIRDKIKRRCEELEVPVVEQPCAYRSQRCSSCGLVRKANRRGKEYSCAGCGFHIDSDLNAARNHEEDLPTVPYSLLSLRKNLGTGFFWKPTGFFLQNGSELRVPDYLQNV